MVASAMLTGEKRGAPTRRGGMTVLGKVTAPKPVNLPSQRLENRGLDPHVEIVPKGTVSWGSSTGRSPPASGNAWGGAAFSSSPPANSGPWSNRPNVSNTRPSSGGSGTRPSTAGSDHSHDPATPNAWCSASSRPSSASGALGLAYSQSTLTRPCSAESRPGSSHLSRFADSSIESGGPWGGSGTAHKLGESHPQPPQFTLTSDDFPTLGSDKNPDLRPQQGNASSMRSMLTSEGMGQKERSQPSTPDWCGNDGITVATWKRDSAPNTGEMPAPNEGHLQKDGFHRQTLLHPHDSWHNEDRHRNPTPSNLTEEEWRRGGPPVAPYGPPGAHGRFTFTPAGYMRPPYEYGPVPYPQRPYGPGGYNRHGEMYGPYVAQPMVAGRPGVPLGHSMYPSQLPFDGYYGPPGVPASHYGNMDEREMAMTRMGGGPGMYGGYPHNQGPVEGPKVRHNEPGSGPQPASLHPSLSREHNDPSAYSMVASEGKDKGYSKQTNVWVSEDAEISSDNKRPFFPGDSNTRRNSVYSISNLQSESNNSRAASAGHRDWGTVSSDEQMDFSKPVFDEEALSSQHFSDSRMLGIESNHEKGSNITRIAEQTSLGDKKNIQVKIKDGRDSYKSLLSEDLSQTRYHDSEEIEPIKATHSEEIFKTGQEHSVAIGVLSKVEKKIVAMVVDEKVQEEDVKFGEMIASNQKIEGYPTSRNHVLSQEAQAVVSPLKRLDQESPMDGPQRDSVVSTPSSERHSALNTSLKLEGGLSSAAGLNNSSHETPKIRDKVQLLKRSNNHPMDNTLDTEEAMQQVHSIQATKGIQEPMKETQKESHTIRGRFNAHEGDTEWRRKVPTTESADKAAKPNVIHVNRQVDASSVPGSEAFGDKPAGESHAQQSSGLHDYDVQRARIKEIKAQRQQQLLREEEDRIKDQKAKAYAKLEELNKRTLAAATPQDMENHKSETVTSTPSSGSEVASEAVQQQQAGGYGNKSSVFRHTAIGNLESFPGDSFVEGKCNSSADHRIQLNFGEQRECLKGDDGIPNKNALSEVPLAQVSVPPETPGDFGKNVSNTLVKGGKNDKGKRENSRRPSNVNREDLKYQMKMEEQKIVPKEMESLSNTNSPGDIRLLPVPVVAVSASTLTSLSTSEYLQKVVPVTVSDSSRVADQLHQSEFPKQTRNRQKAKHYVPEQISSSCQAYTLEITEQVVSPDSGISVKLAGENDMLQRSSSAVVEKSSEIITSGGDGVPVSRKKKNYKTMKIKHKSDRPVVITGSAGLPEHDHGMTVQSNSIVADSKHGAGVLTNHCIEQVDKGVDIQNRKSELASVRTGINDASVAREASAVDRGILQSTDDASAGRIPHVKSQSSKRSYRGPQETRVSDKSQGSEAMVWAPVRAVNHQVTVNDKLKLDQIGVEVQPSGAMSSEVVVQNPIRNRRAEIERYVPKPVAKEQAQHQENFQHPAAGSSVSARDQTDHRNTQGTVKNVVSETRQQHLFISEIKGHIAGSKQTKPNVSWRQRNSNEVRESNKVSHAHQSIEVETALPLQVNEAFVSKTRQAHMETQDFKSEGIEIHPQLHQPDIHKPRHVEQLSKSVTIQANSQHVFHSEAEQSRQLAPVPHLQSSNAAKDQDLQVPYNREQNTHERFYQANRSRSKQKFSARQVHKEGNQFSKLEGLSEEGEKSHSAEQIYSHERPRSSGSWNLKQQGPAGRREHQLHQNPISTCQTDVTQAKIDSHDEHHGFHRQSVQQTILPSHQRTVSDQQEGPVSSAKKQLLQDQSSWQLPVSPRQFEGKNQTPNSDARLQTDPLPYQQSKLTHMDRQAAEKDLPKQTANSTSYQQLRQSGQGHWQQTGVNARTGTRRTDRHGEHSESAVGQNHKHQDTTTPRTLESSFGAGQHHRQVTNKQQALINSDPSKQNLQVHSQAISSQKPQEFYQPKAVLASGNGDKQEINHGTAPHGGSSWAGEYRGSHPYHGRDNNHSRRGRSGGRGGGGFSVRGNEPGSKIENPSKQRMLVDATGGAIPHQVAS